MTDGQEDVTGMAVCIYMGGAQFRSSAIVTSVIYVPDDTPPVTRDQQIADAAQGRIDAMEWFQEATNGLKAGDETPVGLTAFQADKIAAIIGAGRRGHEIYDALVPDALLFLNLLAFEAVPTPGARASITAADLWEKLATVPWPRSGPAQQQPDTNS